MAYMLSMSAFKIGNPVEGFIKMKSDYFTADSGHLCLHGFHVEANPILRALRTVGVPLCIPVE